MICLLKCDSKYFILFCTLIILSTYYLYTETKREMDGIVEDRLNNALQSKLSLVEMKREAEQKEKNRLGKLEVKEKGNARKKSKQRRASIACMDTEIETRKIRKKSLIDEERNLHEAYQLLLGEHHRIMNQRVRHGSISVPINSTSNLTISAEPQTHHQCHCLLKPKQDNNCKGTCVVIYIYIYIYI